MLVCSRELRCYRSLPTAYSLDLFGLVWISFPRWEWQEASRILNPLEGTETKSKTGLFHAYCLSSQPGTQPETPEGVIMLSLREILQALVGEIGSLFAGKAAECPTGKIGVGGRIPGSFSGF